MNSMSINSKDVFYEPKITVGKADADLIPSEKGYRIELSVRVKKFPIRDLNTGKDRYIEVITPLRINVCRMIFVENGRRLHIDLMNTEQYWRDNYNVIFFKNIYNHDIEHISKWTHGKTFFIGLETEGIAMADGLLVQFQLGFPPSLLKFGSDEFESSFLKNTGLEQTYTREFDLSSPVIDNLSSAPSL